MLALIDMSGYGSGETRGLTFHKRLQRTMLLWGFRAETRRRRISGAAVRHPNDALPDFRAVARPRRGEQGGARGIRSLAGQETGHMPLHAPAIIAPVFVIIAIGHAALVSGQGDARARAPRRDGAVRGNPVRPDPRSFRDGDARIPGSTALAAGPRRQTVIQRRTSFSSSSEVLPARTMRPRSITAIRSARSTAKSKNCSTRTIAIVP